MLFFGREAKQYASPKVKYAVQVRLFESVVFVVKLWRVLLLGHVDGERVEAGEVVASDLESRLVTETNICNGSNIPDMP